MFHSARLKLTAWYLLSIMSISVIFSAVAYEGLTSEIRRGLHIQALSSTVDGRRLPSRDRLRPRDLVPGLPFTGNFPPAPLAYDAALFAEAQRRVALQLVFLNVGILVLAGVAGYFLAGRTLRPIELMMEDQKRFTADASHELRTPLTALRSEIEVALRDQNLDEESARQVLGSNLEEIGRLQMLSDNLLTLGRYQSETPTGRFEDVSLVDVADEALRSVQALADKKHIEIDRNVSDIILHADGKGLVNLLVIFLDNAIKYSHEGGKIALRANPIKDRASITIRDHGIGVSADELPHIFKRFYRADASRATDDVDGHGLGLSIAKAIIDAHKGTVDVHSAPGRGTTFTVTIPRKR